MKENSKEVNQSSGISRRRRVVAAIGGAICAGVALGSQYLLLQPEFNYTSQQTEAPLDRGGPALAAIEGLALGGVFLASVVGTSQPKPAEQPVIETAVES